VCLVVAVTVQQGQIVMTIIVVISVEMMNLDIVGHVLVFCIDVKQPSA
jgi:hypothetical protein